jgi:hypothetical protein
MRASPQTLSAALLTWLIATAPGCSMVIGIDKDYTDLAADAADQGGSAGTGKGGSSGNSSGGATTEGGSSAQGGSSASAGSAGQGGSAPCKGQSSSGGCWYLGNLGASCTSTCAAHGGNASDAASFVGTTAQGGSLAKCATLLAALGDNLSPIEATRSDGMGIGCHVYGVKTYWLSSPTFSPSAVVVGARPVCGCVQ